MKFILPNIIQLIRKEDLMADIHIIHLRGTDYSQERFSSSTKEMNEQGITDYKVWDGIHDPNKVRAISQAHKQIVSYAKENRFPEICIMEDDCVFLGHGAFDYYLQNKPTDFSIYIGGLSNVLKKEEDYVTDFRGLTLYTINEKFYDKFLSVPETVNIDAALKGLGKYYLCPKIVCSQKSGYSYHKKRHTDYAHLLKQYDIYEGKRDHTDKANGIAQSKNG